MSKHGKKELLASELVGIKAVEWALRHAFGNDTQVELLFANEIESDVSPPSYSGDEVRYAHARLTGVYRTFHPHRQGRVKASVILAPEFLGNKDAGLAHTCMCWRPSAISMRCSGDWVPSCGTFSATWQVTESGPSNSISVLITRTLGVAESAPDVLVGCQFIP